LIVKSLAYYVQMKPLIVAVHTPAGLNGFARSSGRWLWRLQFRFSGVCLLCVGLLPIWAPLAAPASMTSQSQALDSISVLTQTVDRPTVISGLGRVLPTVTLALRAQRSGQIQQSRLHLGQIVSAREIVGYLGGAGLDAQIARASVEWTRTQAEVKAAQRALEIDRKTLAYAQTTKKTLIQGELALKLAMANQHRAQSALNALQEERVLRSPTQGVVTQIDQAEGSLVQPGMTIARIEPLNGLQLRATFYPAEAGQATSQIHPGMTGWFKPLGSGQKIAIRVQSLLPLDPQNGALPVILQPVIHATSHQMPRGWQSGAMGSIELDANQQTVIPIPTRALVLDQGQWWVLVWQEGHWQRQRVHIGSSHGSSTDIISGLSAGERVRVDQTYLAFHHQFSLRYQQPD
jgi:RND family efflux transporter MFP subunit